jgi:aspartokinase
VRALADRLSRPTERPATTGARREAVPGRLVYKFGGTSVADARRIREVARLVAQAPTRPVVGHGLMEEPGTDALVFWEVSRTPVYLISQASDVSLSFLVDEERAPDLVRRLHTGLIELRDEAGRAHRG